MKWPRTEVVLLIGALVLFAVCLVGLAVQAGLTVHPVILWLLGTVITGAAVTWLGHRLLEERTNNRILAAVPRAEPARYGDLPPGTPPTDPY